MKTPKHLTGLVGVLTAVEEACEGTGHVWMIAKDDAREGYYADISRAGTSYRTHSKTPAGALAQALMMYNTRTKGERP